MSRKKKLGNGRFSVSGPEIDREGFVSPHSATAYAQNAAGCLKIEGAAYYVRDVTGELFARVERQKDGTIVTTRGPLALELEHAR